MPTTEQQQYLERQIGQRSKPIETVYICSPLAGDIQRNIFKARQYAKYAIEQGDTSIALHITELFDDQIAKERELGL